MSSNFVRIDGELNYWYGNLSTYISFDLLEYVIPLDDDESLVSFFTLMDNISDNLIRIWTEIRSLSLQYNTGICKKIYFNWKFARTKQMTECMLARLDAVKLRLQHDSNELLDNTVQSFRDTVKNIHRSLKIKVSK